MYLYAGWYGFNVVLRRGGTIWTVVSRTDPRISPAMRTALSLPVPAVKSGAVEWHALEQGLEVGELPVLADNVEVDRILLTRIDPTRFRIEVLNHPPGNREIDDWIGETGAVFAINGSYYNRYGAPATPLVSNGRRLGPESYAARHGAFLASGATATVVDLAGSNWEHELARAENAFVNFPLLIDKDGSSRAGRSDPRWLANRSFLAEDRSGRIVFGTTMEAFFSLDRLAAFLQTAPVELVRALNLDGGPPACQAVRAGSYTRSFCGRWETQTRGEDIILLTHAIGQRRWGLPIVLVAKRR